MAASSVGGHTSSAVALTEDALSVVFKHLPSTPSGVKDLARCGARDVGAQRALQPPAARSCCAAVAQSAATLQRKEVRALARLLTARRAAVPCSCTLVSKQFQGVIEASPRRVCCPAQEGSITATR
jgi:hypothetical protein